MGFVSGAFKNREGVLRGLGDKAEDNLVAEAAPKPGHPIVKPRKKRFRGIEIARRTAIGKAMNGILFDTVSDEARAQSRPFQHIEDPDRRQEEMVLLAGQRRQRLARQAESTPIRVEISAHRREGRQNGKAPDRRFHKGLKDLMGRMVHRDEAPIGVKGGRGIGKGEVEPPVLGIGLSLEMLTKLERDASGAVVQLFRIRL